MRSRGEEKLYDLKVRWTVFSGRRYIVARGHHPQFDNEVLGLLNDAKFLSDLFKDDKNQRLELLQMQKTLRNRYRKLTGKRIRAGHSIKIPC